MVDVSNNFPPGVSDSIQIIHAEMECKECQRTWRATGYRQLGYMGLVNDDDYICPECGEEGELVEWQSISRFC